MPIRDPIRSPTRRRQTDSTTQASLQRAELRNSGNGGCGAGQTGVCGNAEVPATTPFNPKIYQPAPSEVTKNHG